MVSRFLFLISLLLIPFSIQSIGLREINIEDEYEESTGNPTSSTEVIKVRDDTASPIDLQSEIKSTTGIQINSTGSVDSFSTIMIRGASSSGTDIFLNGVRLNSSMMSTFDISLIPDELIEKIEIYKGFSPVSLGTPNLGGAVNIITRKGESSNCGLKLSYGSFNSMNINGFSSYKNGDSNYFISVYLRKTDGDYEFVNHNGTPLNKEDDRIELRQNNFRSEYSLYIGSSKRVNGYYSLNVFVLPFFSKGGLSGIENIKTENASFNSLRNIFSLENQFAFRSFLNKATLGYSNIYSNTDYDDRLGELNPMSADQINTSSIKHQLYMVSDLAFFRNYLLMRFSLSDETIDRLSLLHSDNYFSGKRQEYSAYLEDSIELINDRLFFIPSLGIKKIDDSVNYSSKYLMEKDKKISNDRDIRTLRGGLYLRLTDEFNIKSAITYVERYPDIYEMFGDGLYIQPNPKLKNEEGRLFETGLELDIPYLFVSYTLFINKYENLIQFWQNSQRSIKADNISKAEIYGSEFRFKPSIHKSLLVLLGYTHQEPINKTDIPSIKDKILPFRYTDSINLNIGIIFNPFKFEYEYRYTSQNFFDSPNLLPEGGTGDRSIHDIIVDYRLSRLNAIVSFEIRNITDNRVEDIAGYPLPGRMFYLGVQKTFQSQGGNL